MSRQQRSPRPARWAWRGFVAFLLASGTAGAQQVVRIENVAKAHYTGQNGIPDSAEARVVVARDTTGNPGGGLPDDAVLGIDAALQATASCGTNAVLQHVVTNHGSTPQDVLLSVTVPTGWGLELWLDVDGDGHVGAADRRITGAVPIAPGASIRVLAILAPPARGTSGSHVVVLRATSTTRSTVTTSVQDTVSLACLAELRFAKRVDRADARWGDTLRYVLVATNVGAGTASGLVVLDTLPSALRHVPGTLRRDGVALTDASDSDDGVVSAGPPAIVRVAVPVLAAGDSAVVAFLATVAPTAQAGIATNLAHLLADSTRIDARADTRVRTPQVTLTKRVVSGDTVRVGEDVTYRIAWDVPADGAVLDDAVVTDTLPAEFSLVSAVPAATAQGNVLTWAVGTLQPGAHGEITLRVRLDRLPASGRELVNRVTLRSTNAASASASATAVRAAGVPGLALAKVATVLEARLGDVVPWVLTVRNTGSEAVRDVVVQDLMPSGTAMVKGTMRGADSVTVRGKLATFHLGGAIEPGEARDIRYALSLVSVGGRQVVENRAVATAGIVRTDTAVAWVRVQRGAGLAARTIVGKVFEDRNENGVQDAGEPGAARVRIWSADGEVVTTDREGRFSFRDVRPGTTLLRLDTLGLPNQLVLAKHASGLVTLRTDGWVSPRASFALVKRAAADSSTAPVGMSAAFLLPAANTDTTSAEWLAKSPTDRAKVLREAKRLDLPDDAGVQFLSPTPQSVLGTNRLLVRVRGEAGMNVRLLDNGREVGASTLRPDGTQDFIGLELREGPHRFELEGRNAAGRLVRDSIAVHGAGAPATIVLADTVPALHLDAATPSTVRFRVLDQWGMPVAAAPQVTVTTRSALVDAPDADSTSVGMQQAVSPGGWVELPLRAAGAVGPGEVVVKYGALERHVPITVLPSVEPLMATATGQVGVGASPDDFGAITVRGTTRNATAVTVSYDSRRTNDPTAFFARGYDPLDEARYPTLGDGSERRIVGQASQGLSAKVERGFSWLQWGDVSTATVGDGFGGYRRSLTGLSGRFVRGLMTYEGFGSLTSQAVVQRQLRGNGTSGPYVMGRDVRPGTDRVAIEVRARDNAARVVSREELARFVDYQVDYTTGVVLLRRPIPTADAFGNPVFLVATAERSGAGPQRMVGGGRVALDAAKWMPGFRADSAARLTIGVSGAQDGGAASTDGTGSRTRLVGADLQARARTLEARLNVLHADAGDSAATATDGTVTWAANENARLEATWSRVGRGFTGSFDPRFAQPASELRLAGETRVMDAVRLSLAHQRQSFAGFGVARHTTTLRSEERLGGRAITQELSLANDTQRSDSLDVGSTSLSGRAAMELNDRTQLWAEGNRVIGDAPVSSARPNQVGAGVRYTLLPGTTLEGSQRWIEAPGSAGTYGVTSFNVRTSRLFGSEVWGGLERSASETGGDVQSNHSAVLGMSQRWSLKGGWNASTSFERRVGLSRASLVDPVRALPFAQSEPDRWSASGGLEWLPGENRPRFTARGELFGGQERRGYRMVASGDAIVNEHLTLLSLHDWSSDRMLLSTGAGRSRRDRSLVGLALRPIDDDRFNALMKVEWRRTDVPLASGLSAAGLKDTRVIASFDGIWTPMAKLEVDTRYATRWMQSDRDQSGVPMPATASHYLGARVDRQLVSRLGARLDLRALLDQGSRTARWNVAPAAVLRLPAGLELEGGYRLGDLRDRDFAVNGGHGAYALLGVSLTEGVLRKGAARWRERIARDR